MEFLSAAHTDVGTRKNINQDSVLLIQNFTSCGQVLMAVVCDGMGGLAKGEVASGTLVTAFKDWYLKELKNLLYDEHGNVQTLTMNMIHKSWTNVIQKVDKKVSEYGAELFAQCGTTVAGILFAQGKYFIVNVGDSRVYLLKNNSMSRLTTDHTFIEQEMKAGRLTYEQAIRHPQRNALLQCVGVGMPIEPEFVEGVLENGTAFLLCSDGFRHVIKEEEFLKLLSPEKLDNENDMTNALIYFTELNKSRQERDNISSIVIKVKEN